LKEITPLIHVKNVAKITAALADAWISSQPEKDAEETAATENPSEPEPVAQAA
jgi:hypothetical protein